MVFNKDYRLYGESFWTVLEKLHSLEDELQNNDAEALLLNRPMMYESLKNQYEEASSGHDRNCAIDFEEHCGSWPDQITIQYREEQTGGAKLRLKLREYRIIYDAIKDHSAYPRFIISASLKQDYIKWFMVINVDSLMNMLAKLCVGELSDDQPSRLALREQGVFQRVKGHGGSWSYDQHTKQFHFDIEAIHKTGVRYFYYPGGMWLDPHIMQNKLPF